MDILSLPTRGIINRGTILNLNSLLVNVDVEQGPVIPSPEISIPNSGGGGGGGGGIGDKREERSKKKYYIKTTIHYEGKIYTKTIYTNKNIKVKKEDLQLEIIDKIPTIKIKFIENE